jgi:isoquinoline 1-oxidoreductase alpha subunit
MDGEPPVPVHKIVVNEITHDVECPGDMPLLWAIRDCIGLTGTKFGCGVGQCGACTVQVDGVATRSCVLPISSVVGHTVTTIEGIGLSRIGRSLQAAWLEHDVPQCGYCQGGQILSAEALLRNNPHPSESEINAAMAGNICRCGTYIRIRAAINSIGAGSVAHRSKND